MLRKLIAGLGAILVTMSSVVVAEVEVKLAPDLDYVDVMHEGNSFRIQRNQDQENLMPEGWTKTSRKCPPFCSQPVQVAPGVTTVGELEVFDFMEKKLNSGSGIIIDARVFSWYEKGTIPGSINIPFTTFDHGPTDLEIEEAFTALGVKPRGEIGAMDSMLSKIGMPPADKTDHWDFTTAPDLLLWCNGPWCGQSPRAIKGLLALGYPAHKLYYYRGGMQMWQVLGLPTVIPGS
ncbi:MAG: rhodanese-like domain-containing protein [Chromatiales bacterium]|nr:rhodanese-like domain-containing protein [Chromatiales bacterium]